jgi:hypothetical protein
MIKVLDPSGEPGNVRRQLAMRPKDLLNARVGFLDNSKPRADVLLRRVEEVLRRDYQIESVWRRKPSVGIPAGALLGDLAGCIAVITASGD